MTNFTDALGRQWPVSLTVSSLLRVRDLTGLDLASLDGFREDGPVARVSSDPLLLAQVLWAVCQPEAERGGISRESFQDAVRGDAITAGADALLEALADFFPGAQSRLLRKVIQAARELREKAEKEAESLLESTPLTAAAVSPELSASTQAR